MIMQAMEKVIVGDKVAFIHPMKTGFEEYLLRCKSLSIIPEIYSTNTIPTPVCTDSENIRGIVHYVFKATSDPKERRKKNAYEFALAGGYKICVLSVESFHKDELADLPPIVCRAYIEAFLRDIFLFKNISQNDIKLIAREVIIVHFKKGATVFSQGEETNELYVLLNGKVRASLSEGSGNDVTLSSFYSGDFLGEMSFLDDAPRSATVTAEVDSDLAVLRRESLLDVIKLNPLVSIQMLATVIKRLRETNDMVGSLAFSDVNERLLKFLLKVASMDGENLGNGSYKIKKITHQDLAAQIGSSKEVVSNVMQALSSRKQVVDHDGHFIFSPDN